MRIFIIFLLSFLFTTPAWTKSVYVKPYVRSDGTMVQGHYRTAPDNNVYNNWSTKGNVNPYTGQEGTVNPYNMNKQQNAPNYRTYDTNDNWDSWDNN